MTNKEKFIEIFSGTPDDTICPIYCSAEEDNCPCFDQRYCEAGSWWNEEYEEKTDG